MSTTPVSQIDSNLKRGSTWAKWDLHIHTPCSALNNQFPRVAGTGEPDWEQYLAALEKLEGFAALGATDYFSIEGYKQLRAFQQQGRIANIPLIVPNVELRLDKFVGVQGGAKQRRLNYHVIFSDLIDPEDIEEHFLRNLTFACEAYPQGPEESWRISRAQLTTLGQRLIQENKGLSGQDPFAVGCTNATVSAQQVKAVLEANRSKFYGRYLLVLADYALSDMKWEGQDHQTRRVLLQGADAIFSANPAARAWALGQSDLSPCQFRKEFRSLKPCVHGSDAHDLESIGKPAHDRFCWIKAESTFEGLKQILCEPADRVTIGESAPDLKHSYQVLSSIQIRQAPTWFSEQPIPLNADLISVIGGRGSGKSAIAELIAFAGGASKFSGRTDLRDTFLLKASKKSPVNVSPIPGAVITLEWQDGKAEQTEISPSLHHDKTEEKVKYLPQSFVEHLCDPEHTNEIEKEIERVIFQRIEPQSRMGASDFGELRQRATEAIVLKMENVRRNLTECNRMIFELRSRIALRPAKQKELDQNKTALDALQKKPPEVPSENDSDLAALRDLNAKKRDAERRAGEVRSKISKIAALRTRMQLFGQQLQAFNAETANLLREVGLETNADAFSIAMPAETGAILSARERELNEELETLERGTSESQASLFQLKEQIKQVEDRLTVSDVRRAELDKYQRECEGLKTAIEALGREIEEIDGAYLNALTAEQDKRLGYYLDYFGLLREEQDCLARLYAPLHKTLQEGNAIDQKLMFVSRITADIPAHTSRGLEIVDRSRKGQYRGDETLLEQALRGFFATIEDATFDREVVKEQVTALRNTFQISDSKSIRIGDQLRRGKTKREFDDWFFATDYFHVTYCIRFDDKNLELLSPGQKGIVLLLLYLEIEREDSRPLIIDQPEENLDNLSVYDHLIEYFRHRKQTRQIIVITHNPNLVVNTDSEQVIVADFDGARQPKITYHTGALEDASNDYSHPGIREAVCKILEGGEEAFRRREERYSLPRS